MAVTRPACGRGCGEQTPPSLPQAVPGGGSPYAGRGQPTGHLAGTAMPGRAGRTPCRASSQGNSSFCQASLRCSRGQQTHSAVSPLPAHRSAQCLSFPISQNPHLPSPLRAAGLSGLLKLRSDWPADSSPCARQGGKPATRGCSCLPRCPASGQLRRGQPCHRVRDSTQPPAPGRAAAWQMASTSSKLSPVRHDGARDGAPARPSHRQTATTPSPPQ